jgi:hypothetical protein
VTILRVLRPVESAVRRLIVASARGLSETPSPVRSTPAGGIKPGKMRKPRAPLFQLEDPREPMMSSERAGTKRGGPRIWSIAPTDPTIPALWASRMVSAARPDADPDDSKMTSVHIARRLIAIKTALDDLPRQAKRLQRWIARRKRISESRFIYTSPLRHGRPPGLPKSKRKRSTHQVEDILQGCQWLAFEARHNTS